jgi:hypothetical protein
MPRFDATTTVLGNAEVYTGGTLLSDLYDSVVGTVFSDQSGTAYVDHSTDGVNWDVSTSIAVTGGTGAAVDVPLYGGYFRIRYVNGATPQTVFRFKVKATASGTR